MVNPFTKKYVLQQKLIIKNVNGVTWVTGRTTNLTINGTLLHTGDLVSSTGQWTGREYHFVFDSMNDYEFFVMGWKDTTGNKPGNSNKELNDGEIVFALVKKFYEFRDGESGPHTGYWYEAEDESIHEEI